MVDWLVSVCRLAGLLVQGHNKAINDRHAPWQAMPVCLFLWQFWQFAAPVGDFFIFGWLLLLLLLLALSLSLSLS